MIKKEINKRRILQNKTMWITIDKAIDKAFNIDCKTFSKEIDRLLKEMPYNKNKLIVIGMLCFAHGFICRIKEIEG